MNRIRELQIVRAAVEKDWEPNITLLWGTRRRLEEEKDLRTPEGQ